ncbi:MAG: hypothetical protein WAT66_07175 [Actinomycetota bacterium]
MVASSDRRIRRSALAIATVACAVCALLPAAGHPVAGTTLAFDNVVLKKAGGEPTVSVSPSGRVILVAGLGPDAPAIFYRSTDFGRTFRKITPSFPRAGGGDWDATFIDDRTIVAVDLSLGDGVYVHRSEDGGDNWTTTTINLDVYDRPWIAHAGPDNVYVVAKGFDMIPYLFRSTDGGRSFGTPPIPLIVYGLPGQGGPNIAEAITGGLNAYVDHLTVDPKSGDVYVLYGVGTLGTLNTSQPLGIANRLYVAHLEGDRMVSYPVFLGANEDSSISGFNWLTVDPNGTVYALANGRVGGHHSARVSYSKDHGRTWSPLVDLAPKGAANVYGSIAAGSPGVLSLVYLRGTTEDPNEPQQWFAEMARVTSADTPTPRVGRVRSTKKPIHTRDICFDGILCGLPGFGSDRNLLDFIWNEVTADGRAFAAISSDGPESGGEADTTPDVIILRQKAGPSHRVTPTELQTPAKKPAVRGTKTVRPRATLPATGVAGTPTAPTAALVAIALCVAAALRRVR